MSITLPGSGPADRAIRETIRPFQFDVRQAELDDLRQRITNTRLPDRETDPSQGVRLETIQALARYWASEYDWRRFEARFAAFPHFITEIDGVDIHFIHVALEARGCAAPDRDAWLARLDGRAAEAHRPADRSHGARSAVRPTRSISSSRPCQATASRESRPRRAGTRSASPRPGSS